MYPNESKNIAIISNNLFTSSLYGANKKKKQGHPWQPLAKLQFFY